MGSSVDASPVMEVAAPLPLPVPTGEVPGETPVSHASGPAMEAVESAKKEGESPMFPVEKGKESGDESEPAPKKARVEEEYEVDAKAIKLCLEGCQRALDYVARQQLTIAELQKQMIECGSVMNHADSCQRYALASIQKQGEDVRNAAWQLTGNKNEAKTTIKSLVQQLLTCANEQNKALKKLAESVTNQTTQFGESFGRFQESLLLLQGQVADAFAAQKAAPLNLPQMTPGRFQESLLLLQGQVADAFAAQKAAPLNLPQMTPATPGPAEGLLPGYGSMPASVAAPAMMTGNMAGANIQQHGAPPAPPPKVMGGPQQRAPIHLSLRMTDGTTQSRTASPTPHFDERLKYNQSYALCGDGAYRRLLQ
eukprot:s103_g72.t1